MHSAESWWAGSVTSFQPSTAWWAHCWKIQSWTHAALFGCISPRFFRQSCDGTCSASTFRPQRPKATAVRLFNLLHKNGHAHMTNEGINTILLTSQYLTMNTTIYTFIRPCTSTNTNNANIYIFFFQAQNTVCVFLSELLNKSPKGSGRVMSLLVSRWAWSKHVRNAIPLLCQLASLQSAESMKGSWERFS